MLLPERDPDTGVGDAQGDYAVGTVQGIVIVAPARSHRLSRECHPALLGELESVAQQVVEDLLQALRVGRYGLWQTGSQVDREAELRSLSDVPERALEKGRQLCQRPIGDLEGHGSGLDLRHVENVVYQTSQ